MLLMVPSKMYKYIVLRNKTQIFYFFCSAAIIVDKTDQYIYFSIFAGCSGMSVGYEPVHGIFKSSAKWQMTNHQNK